MNKRDIDFALSIKNFQAILFQKYEKDFTFIVNGKKYPTSRLFSDIISPKIRKMHLSDENINEYTITINNEGEKDHFSEFLNLCFFKTQKLDFQLQKEYSTYFKILGNIDEYFRLDPTLTISNSIQRLQSLLNDQEDENSNELEYKHEYMKKLIYFISINFSEISKEKNIDQLPIEIINDIISRDSLQICDEDSLLEFIMNLYKNDHQYSKLFSKVIFRNLSEKMIDNFIRNFSFEDLNSEIWDSIISLFLLPEKEEIQSIEQTFKHEFKPEKNHEFDGIMNYLRKKTHGNIHDNRTIEITSNSILKIDGMNYHPKNLVDYRSDNIYHSNDEENIFICFDFKDRKVQLSSYSIESFNISEFQGHLRNWVIEVSNDSENWEEVDRHLNDSKLNGSKIITTFHLKNKISDFYRFIRFRQTGYSWWGYNTSNSYTIYFVSIEFFGIIDENNEKF